jgi:hypothetical protein
MTLTSPNHTLPDYVIAQINSLGGPPLPMQQTGPTLKVTIENMDASTARISGWRVASSLAGLTRY